MIEPSLFHMLNMLLPTEQASFSQMLICVLLHTLQQSGSLMLVQGHPSTTITKAPAQLKTFTHLITTS